MTLHYRTYDTFIYKTNQVLESCFGVSYSTYDSISVSDYNREPTSLHIIIIVIIIVIMYN